MIIRKVKKIRRTKNIILDRDVTKDLGEFFGTSIVNTTPTDDDKSLVFHVNRGETKLHYRFDKKTINGIKNDLSLDNQPLQISLGRRTARLWWTLIVLAYEQGSGTVGNFSYDDILRLWGAKRSGKLYEDIKDMFLSLASATLTMHRKDKNGKPDILVYHLINSARIKGDENGGTTFSFELNEDALGITAHWLRYGQLSASQQAKGYLSVPTAELKQKGKNLRYINFCERLVLFPGGVVKAQTILEEWLKLPPSRLKHKKDCEQLLINILTQAKEEGKMVSFITNFPAGKNWLESWSVKIVKTN